MDEQGEETSEVGGISSPSNWRAETLTADPKPKENFFKRLMSRFRGNNRAENQSGVPAQEMKQAAERREKVIPGATVDVVQSGDKTEVSTTVPGETKPAEEENAE